MLAIGAPAGRVYRSPDPGDRAQAVTGTVADQAEEFVKGHDDWIVAVDRFDDAVNWFLLGQFGYEGAEHLVPDDEDASIIGVEIARIGGVVDAVMAGCVHDALKPARQLVDGFSMDPELIDQIDPAREENEQRVEAKHDHWCAEQETARERAEPGLAQGRAEIVMGAGMVSDMLHPHEPEAMREPMFPVIGRVVEDEDNRETPPCHGYLEQVVGPKQKQQPQRDGGGQGVDDSAAAAHDQAGDRVGGLIISGGALGFDGPPFPGNAGDEKRDGDDGRGQKFRHGGDHAIGGANWKGGRCGRASLCLTCAP